MADKKVVWSGCALKCDFCDMEYPKAITIVDGKTRYGPWALMCEHCWLTRGVGQLGTGFGQMYDANTGIKVDG